MGRDSSEKTIMPPGHPEPLLPPPAADHDSQSTRIEPTPSPLHGQLVSESSTGHVGTTFTAPKLPAASETIAEPIFIGSPLVQPPPSAISARSATAPVAAQETLIEAHGQVSTPTTTYAKPGKSGGIPRMLGDYELPDELGRGGMSIVYRAKQRSVNRLVALKVIRANRLASMTKATKQKIIERFCTEAEAAARIDHDNLVTVYEVGYEAGCHFLRDAVRRGGQLVGEDSQEPR